MLSSMSLSALRKEIYKEKCKYSYQAFLEHIYHGKWKPAKHLVVLCKVIDDVINGKIDRLIVEMPPRHGKSMSLSRVLPAYFLGRYPDKEVVLTSYSSKLAESFGRTNRRVIKEFGKPLFGIQSSAVKDSNSEWEIEDHEGKAICVGMDSAITGHGADLLILDDPIKGRAEAESESTRNNTFNTYNSVLRTRLHPGGAIIIILTRWHNDDLVGRLLNPEDGVPEDWTIVRFPAIAEEGDPLGREVGEALWEEWFSLEELCKLRDSLGTYEWSALYQQNPVPAIGNIISMSAFKRYGVLPKFDTIIQSWDCTFKDVPTSDFVVGQVWGKSGVNKYLLDQVRLKMDTPSTIMHIRNFLIKYPGTNSVLVEAKANGMAVIQMLKHEVAGLIPVEPVGGKVARVNAIAPQIQAGNIHIPHSNKSFWVNDFLTECANFPNGKHDDQVDAMSQAVLHLSNTSQTRMLGTWRR